MKSICFSFSGSYSNLSPLLSFSLFFEVDVSRRPGPPGPYHVTFTIYNPNPGARTRTPLSTTQAASGPEQAALLQTVIPGVQPPRATGLQPSMYRTPSQWEGVDLGELHAQEVITKSSATAPQTP
jgi:hypothetical protein